MGSVIRRVKLLNIEEGKKLPYKARSTLIEIREGTNTYRWKSPIRIQTQQYLKAKAKIPSEISIFSPMGIAHYLLGLEKMQKLLTSNEYASRQIYKLRVVNATFLHFPIRSFLFQPSTQAREYLGQNPIIAERFMRLIINFAREAGFNTVLIPFLDMPLNDWLRLYEKIVNEYYDVFAHIVPVIPIKLEPSYLEKLIVELKNKFIETDIIQLMGFIYTRYRTAPISHEVIWENLKEENVAILLTNVERNISFLNDISGLHYESFVLGDIFSPKITRFYGGKSKPIEHRIRFFNRSYLTVNTLSNIFLEKRINTLVEELKAVYSTDYEEMVQEAIINYKEAENDEKKYAILNAISKIHETVMSNIEFETTSKFVERGETEEYVRQKEILKKSLEKVLPIKLNHYF